MLGGCGSEKKAVMKKALNAILFIAAGWALNTGTHSLEEAGRRDKTGKRIHLHIALNTIFLFRDTTRKLFYPKADSLNAACERC